MKRPIWLLDEPTSALDRDAQDTLAGLMREHLSGGGIIVAATHGPIGLDRARELQLGATPHECAALAAIFMRDVRLAVRVGGGGGIGVLFFLIVVVLMPFAIGPDLALLGRIGPAILWLGALLASLLTLDRLFAADHEDGSLDLILMSDTPLELAVAAKALAHWLTTGLPLVIAMPLLGLFMNLDGRASAAVALTLLAGTPALTFIGLIGAALSVALRRGGLLLAVLVLPLDRSGADLRRLGVECRDRRAAAVRNAVHDPVRADAGEPRHRHICRRRGLAAWDGVTPHCVQHCRLTDTADGPDRSRQPHALSRAHRAAAAVSDRADRARARDRALSRPGRARRLPAGRDREDHVHPRAVGLALHVRLDA